MRGLGAGTRQFPYLLPRSWLLNTIIHWKKHSLEKELTLVLGQGKYWKWKCSHSVVSDCLQPHELYVAHQAPLSTESPGKNTGVGCHALLWAIFPTQGLNLGILHFKQILYHLSHQGKYWVGQKVHLGFPIRCYGKIRTNFLANPIWEAWNTLLSQKRMKYFKNNETH